MGRVWVVGLLFAGAIAAGCSYTPTLPSPLSAAGSQVLEGSVYPGGTTRVWVTTVAAGTLMLDLTTVNPGGLTVGLGLGTLEDGACDGLAHVNAVPGNTPQITAPIPQGTYCVDVSDAGGVGLSGVTFSITAHLQ
jgi:hypothetical protein